VADTLLAALQDAPPEGLSRKQILSETFHGNLRADELDRVLRLLERRKMITRTNLPPEGGRGRPKEMVVALLYELNEFNDLNRKGYVSLSNDAVKSFREGEGISTNLIRTKYEFNGVAHADIEPYIHEYLDVTGHCNDCGMKES
jgi:hypothetical protein